MWVILVVYVDGCCIIITTNYFVLILQQPQIKPMPFKGQIISMNVMEMDKSTIAMDKSPNGIEEVNCIANLKPCFKDF